MNKRMKRVLLMLVPLVVISPCIFFFWLFIWDDFRIENSLRLYSGLENVGEAYGYYGADSGLKIRYYWTPESIDQVKTYYSAFTYPFVTDTYSKNMIITIFNVSGAQLKHYPIAAPPSDFSYPEDRYCEYTLRYQCINIRLLSVESGYSGHLPVLVSPPSWTNVTQAAPTRMLNGGTLVIYSYFVNDF